MRTSATAVPGKFCLLTVLICTAAVLLACYLLFAGYLAPLLQGTWRGNLVATEQEHLSFSLFYYLALPMVLLFQGFYLLLAPLGRSRLERPTIAHAEVWILAILTCWKFLAPLGAEIERFPLLPHLHPTATTLGLVLLGLAPLALLPKPYRHLLAFAVAAEATGIVLFDIVHLRHLQFLPSAADFETGAVAITWESFRASLRPADLRLLVDLPVWMILFLSGGPDLSERWGGRARTALLAVLAGLVLVLPGSIVFREMVSKHDAHWAVRGEELTVNAVGLPGHHLMDLFTWLQSKRPLPPEEAAAAEHYLDVRSAVRSDSEREENLPILEGYNLILISFESLHDAAIGLEVDGRAVTPTLNRCAERAWLRAALQDVSGAGRSGDADFAALNGLLPLPNGGTTVRASRNQLRALPQILVEKGYAAYAFCLMRGFLWNIRRNLPRYGFEVALFQDDIVAVNDGAPDDRRMYRKSLEFLSSSPHRPFLLFLHTATTHHPFAGVAGAAPFPVGRFEGSMVGRYLRALNHADRALEEFLQGLDDLGLSDSTIIALYGDHDAGIYDEPELPDLLGYSLDHEAGRHRADRTPFLVVLPGGVKAERIEAVGSQVDVATTLLPLLGIPTYDFSMIGADLAEERTPPVEMYSGAIVQGDRLAHRSAGGALNTIDLRSGAFLPPLEKEAILSARTRLRISRAIVEGDLIRKDRTAP